MLIQTRIGLHCAIGDFYIDPSRAVETAVITHAHSDHARRGSRRYICAASGVELLRQRIGDADIEGVPFGRPFQLGEVTVSFHPAGHILGSAQVRMEARGEVWVASGDYKRAPDPTCEPFESVACDVFVTEATFGTPSFRWDQSVDLGAEIYFWWKNNARQGINSVLFAYSLGKAQRVLGVLQPHAQEPIYCHPSTVVFTECYRRQGIALAPTVCLSQISPAEILKGALFLVPPTFLKAEAAAILGDSYKTAFASGWTAQRDDGTDKGFLMSDHADWDDLLRTIHETRAKKVYVQHRGHGALVRHLRAKGVEAHPVERLQFARPTEQLAFSLK